MKAELRNGMWCVDYHNKTAIKKDIGDAIEACLKKTPCKGSSTVTKLVPTKN